jgi:crotonobetainyl-CoA:carnitine CoA-transferase CaiB-like acyl-CoA transferase
MAERLFRVIGQADLISDPRFRTNADRVKHRDTVDKIVGEWIVKRNQEETLSIFENEGVTAAPIYHIADLRKDPHVIEREMIVDLPDKELGSAPMHNIIPRLSDSPGGFQRPAPRIGEHTGEVLGTIGYDAEALVDLKNRGVI